MPADRESLDVEVGTGVCDLCPLLVPAACWAFEDEVVTGACGLFLLLVPVARGPPAVEFVTGAFGPRGSRGRGRYWCPRPLLVIVARGP